MEKEGAFSRKLLPRGVETHCYNYLALFRSSIILSPNATHRPNSYSVIRETSVCTSGCITTWPFDLGLRFSTHNFARFIPSSTMYSSDISNSMTSSGLASISLIIFARSEPRVSCPCSILMICESLVSTFFDNASRLMPATSRRYLRYAPVAESDIQKVYSTWGECQFSKIGEYIDNSP